MADTYLINKEEIKIGDEVYVTEYRFEEDNNRNTLNITYKVIKGIFEGQIKDSCWYAINIGRKQFNKLEELPIYLGATISKDKYMSEIRTLVVIEDVLAKDIEKLSKEQKRINKILSEKINNICY